MVPDLENQLLVQLEDVVDFEGFFPLGTEVVFQPLGLAFVFLLFALNGVEQFAKGVAF